MLKRSLLLYFLISFFTQTSFQEQQNETVLLNIKSERSALYQLRSSLGLRTKDWPIKSDPCVTWVGILCENSTVVKINISGFKRTRKGGRKPSFAIDSLANFTNLISFNASGFLLPGSMPNWLGVKVRRLKVLDLRNCGITGGVPFSIGNLTSLSELYLSGNGLTGTIPSSFGMLSRIKVLDLSRNLLAGSVPECFGNLVNVRYLNLSGNSLRSVVPAQIGNLADLSVLDLSCNKFSGDLPVTLWSLPHLSFLDVSDNKFVGVLPNISLNDNVTKAAINLSHNMFYGALTLVLKRFSYVDLSYNYFQGRIPDYASDVSYLDKNCFRGSSSQRTIIECAAFYTKKGLPFDNFGRANHTFPLTVHKHKSKVIILAVVSAGVGVIILFVSFVILLIVCTRRKSRTSQRLSLNLSALGESFSHEKLVLAMNDFNDANLVKNGHSGDIFKGVLEGGKHIIVKRFDMHSGKNSCMVELDFFGKVSHKRFIPLLGHCLEKQKEKFLIYKCMPKGDLSRSLYLENDSDDESLMSLDWITRLKIAIGAAEGLSYLHHECFPPIVHRDVRASSILLDDKYEVRLGSLSEVCTQEEESHSHWITRLLRLPLKTKQSDSAVATATCAYDVYCFGKVLLELVTGRIGISSSSDLVTKDLLESILPYISVYDKELVTKIIDPSLIVDEDLLEEVWAMAVIAKSCLNPKPSKRPLMRYILKALENPTKVVREETTTSAKLGWRSCSGSWNVSWRHSLPCQPLGKDEGEGSGFYLQGNADRCLSNRRHLKDLFPEPVGLLDEERLTGTRMD
ncbi:Concanavalin A-like lectin/glucanase, subgroup [Artemisia annua]|uniref:Concanavalin A-like lectin/glucanase, subgroup n=2 Tax=Artemisia annua TaxID=35608 RepID=A0A2U1NUN2_ARTAN|nr:Concanavalin A-like lectin/glucanase, subgroup [Artemisia annua]